jgi:small GTP-binding protein
MPINAGYEYIAAEKAYLEAQTLEEKITCLEEMIRVSPSHKGAENLRAELKKRLIKFREKLEKGKKVGKGTKKGIRKEGFQVVLVGMTNTGKSALLAAITNAHPRIDSFPYTTKEPEIGTMDYEGVKAQIVDLPSIDSEQFDPGIVHTADAILIVIDSLQQLKTAEETVKSALGKKLVVYNKSDLISEDELRKLNATFRSRKINGLIVSAATGDNLNELKKILASMMNVVRIYMKEPGKPTSNIPMVMHKGATVKDVAEKILKGFSQRIKETKVTGPSSKFPNQKVGLAHIVLDRDIVEFHTN